MKKIGIIILYLVFLCSCTLTTTEPNQVEPSHHIQESAQMKGQENVLNQGNTNTQKDMTIAEAVQYFQKVLNHQDVMYITTYDQNKICSYIINADIYENQAVSTVVVCKEENSDEAYNYIEIVSVFLEGDNWYRTSRLSYWRINKTSTQVEIYDNIMDKWEEYSE